MIINRQNLQGLTIAYSTAYQKAFDETDGGKNYEKIVTITQSTSGETDYKWLGQIPQMREWIGDRELQNLAGYKYTIINKDFEMSFAIDRNDILDDTYGTYTILFESMGESAALHPNELSFTALANGFENLCYDGKTFFAADHVMGDKVYSNLGTTKLSQESYANARKNMMSLKGDKGRTLNIIPNLLVVSPENEEAGLRLLKSEMIGGTTNIFKDTAELLVEPNLSLMPDAWFLLSTQRRLKPIIFQVRKEIEFNQLIDDNDINVFMQKKYLYGADGRSNVGYGFWQMAYGSTGESVG